MQFRATVCADSGTGWQTEIVKEIEATSWARAAKIALETSKKDGILPKHLNGRKVAVSLEVLP